MFEQSSEDLLVIEEEYTRASTSKRLANYIIDLISFYAFLVVLFIGLAFISESFADNLFSSSLGNEFTEQLLIMLLYAVYMSLVELLFKGKSFGKLVTGTRAVNMDGSRISAATAFARGLSRAVPFCAFSALGAPSNPWQDRWTRTMVVEERK